MLRHPKFITEAQFQKQVIDYLTQHNIYFIKTMLCNRRGVPDFLLCINGQFIAIELKSPHGHRGLTPLQSREIEEIKKVGGLAFVCNSMLQFKAIIHQAKREKR